jgi:hypothetical protein
MLSDDRGVDAPAYTEFCAQAHESRLAGSHHISQNPVGYGLVKGAFITK